jgi:integrase
MGTVRPRKRKDGTIGYTAQIRLTKNGNLLHTEALTFDREKAASAWLKKRETELDELAKAGALGAPPVDDPTLAEVIDRYTAEIVKTMGHTKTQCLRTIREEYDIASLKCSQIGSGEISTLAQELAKRGIEPSTVGNYLSHLSSVFDVAKPVWKYPLNKQAMEDAQMALRKLGITSTSRKRDRRPTLEELDKIMNHFAGVQRRRKTANKMTKVIAFAIFSTRRQGEIVRVTWTDLDEEGSRVLVRDMKHPGEKTGNDIWCELPSEAIQIIKSMPRPSPGDTDQRIFPYSEDAISAAFTRAVTWLKIEDLDFHDLRHEGVSRLFEMGRNIPQAACVSGHRSWSSLQRYAHIRQTGDKYAGWSWLSVVTS